MFEIKGSSTSAKVYANQIDDVSYSQIQNMTNHIAFKDKQMCIMPDVHAGNGSVIGFTCEYEDKLIPAVIGVDIGCGMISNKILLTKEHVKLNLLHSFIKENIPHGFQTHNNVNEKAMREIFNRYKESHFNGQPYNEFINDIIAVCKRTNQKEGYVMASLGTLGGGNHFIELGEDANKDLWLTVHTGSRNFGLKVCIFHSSKAKESGNQDKGLDYLEGSDSEQYLKDMQIAQKYATFNRLLISERILRYITCKKDCSGFYFIESVHNYINLKDRIIRKGAISANIGELVIIPWNMMDGLIIAEGKGNKEWNCSAPHGAGRLMSRSQAKKKIALEDFKEVMEGVYSECIHEGTLDESPMAYKNHEEIISLIGDTVEIRHTVKPIFNFKA